MKRSKRLSKIQQLSHVHIFWIKHFQIPKVDVQTLIVLCPFRHSLNLNYISHDVESFAHRHKFLHRLEGPKVQNWPGSELFIHLGGVLCVPPHFAVESTMSYSNANTQICKLHRSSVYKKWNGSPQMPAQHDSAPFNLLLVLFKGMGHAILQTWDFGKKSGSYFSNSRMKVGFEEFQILEQLSHFKISISAILMIVWHIWEDFFSKS